MTRRLTLGYREATAVSATSWLEAGEEVRGHEFHYSQVEPLHGAEQAAWKLAARGTERSEGFVARRRPGQFPARALGGLPADREPARGGRAGAGVSAPPLVVVGIGADGWAGLGEAARAAVLEAEVIVGSQRQLALVPETAALRRPWPSPIDPLVDELCAADGRRDLRARQRRPDAARHRRHARAPPRPRSAAGVSAPSALAFACARLGWPAAEVELVSAVGRPPEVLVQALQPGRRIIAYASGTSGARELARVLRERGFGSSRMVVLEQLGGSAERVIESTAEAWGERAGRRAARGRRRVPAEAGRRLAPRTAGLPDDAYEHDGQITKRAIRAVTLAALAPAPGSAAVGRRRRQRLDRHRVAAQRALGARDRDRGSVPNGPQRAAGTPARSACRSSRCGTGEHRACSPSWTRRTRSSSAGG